MIPSSLLVSIYHQVNTEKYSCSFLETLKTYRIWRKVAFISACFLCSTKCVLKNSKIYLPTIPHDIFLNTYFWWTHNFKVDLHQGLWNFYFPWSSLSDSERVRCVITGHAMPRASCDVTKNNEDGVTIWVTSL